MTFITQGRMSPNQGQELTTGRPSASVLEELILTADDLIQRELYERAGSVTLDEFQEAQETLTRWQRLSRALISIIERT